MLFYLQQWRKIDWQGGISIYHTNTACTDFLAKSRGPILLSLAAGEVEATAALQTRQQRCWGPALPAERTGGTSSALPSAEGTVAAAAWPRGPIGMGSWGARRDRKWHMPVPA